MSENGNDKFKVIISEDDYENIDSFSDMPKGQSPRIEKKFEVHIEDEDALPPELPDDERPIFKGEVYFSNAIPKKPVIEEEPEIPQKPKGTDKAAVLFVTVLVVCSAVLSFIGLSCINDLLAFSRKDDLVTVDIPIDATTNDIIDILADNHLVKQKLFCKFYYTAFSYLKNGGKKSASAVVYNSGIYDVEMNLGLEGYLSKFREIQVSEDTIRVVFPEGWSISQIIERIDKFGVCTKSQMLQSIQKATFEFDFIKKIEPNSSRTFTLEGYLYPDTYEFYSDTDANSVIRKMLERSDEMWTDEYQKRADELGYTRDEIITIASIIQREAANKNQMGVISSVLHNRLRHSASWPVLGCDSTETYINTYVQPLVSDSETIRYANAYNTYTNQGLPPGPICNPGDDAINAALYPENTSYYFFRHDKYGKIYLATTQSEHDANANLVLRANNK